MSSGGLKMEGEREWDDSMMASDPEGHANPVLITEIDHDHHLKRGKQSNRVQNGNNRALASAANGEGKKQKLNSAVSKVEEEMYVFKHGKFTPLPKNVNLDNVISTVVDTLCFSSAQKRNGWKRCFHDPRSVQLVCDFFWWIFCNEFQAKKDKQESRENKQLLFDRISESFVALFHSLTSKRRGGFFSRFYDGLAQVVFLSFHLAYPNSKSKFDESFKERILHVSSIWLLGMRPSRQRSDHWVSPASLTNAHPRNIGRGLSVSTAYQFFDGDDDASEPSPDKNALQKQFGLTLTRSWKARTKKLTRESCLAHVYTKTVQVGHTVMHSPLMEHYLRKHSLLGHLQGLVVRFTVDETKPLFEVENRRNPPRFHRDTLELYADDVSERLQIENGDDRESKIKDLLSKETFHDVVTRIKKKRKQRMKEHRDALDQLKHDVQAIQQKSRAMQDQVEIKRHQAFRGDVHELSNYLVSMCKMSETIEPSI